MRKTTLMLIFSVLIAGCAGTVDPYSLSIGPSDTDVLIMPQECEHFYEHDMKIVAVTEFANNTTYQDTDYHAVSSQRGAIITYGGAGAFSSYNEVSKYVTPQLGEFAQSTVENIVVSLGGATVVSRSQIEAVLKEQQFQMTIADPSTMVDFGMLMGAQYVITGSVDNIAMRYTPPVTTKFDTSTSAGLIAALGSAVYNATASGWEVSTTLTVNIIDVSTGKIVATHRNQGSANIGDAPTFTMDQIVAGAKKAMNNGMYRTVAFFNEHFEMNVYINEIRGDKKMVRLNIGTEQGVKPGDLFLVMNVVKESDFRTGTSKCTLIQTSIGLKISKYITKDSAWAEVAIKDKSQQGMLKIGSIAKRIRAQR